MFRPERFIDTHGQLVKDDWLLNFGVGKFITLLQLESKAMQNSLKLGLQTYRI